jgi:hypothetical protein
MAQDVGGCGFQCGWFVSKHAETSVATAADKVSCHAGLMVVVGDHVVSGALTNGASH